MVTTLRVNHNVKPYFYQIFSSIFNFSTLLCFKSQTLRDEMVQLEEKHCQELNIQKLEHKQLMESHASEQLSLREELRKELAQVHIEKFSAMAAELSHVHKVRKRAVGHLKLSVNQLEKC